MSVEQGLHNVVNPIWDSFKPLYELDESVQQRYYIEIFDNRTGKNVEADQTEFRFLVQNKVDWINWKEAVIHIQATVDPAKATDLAALPVPERSGTGGGAPTQWKQRRVCPSDDARSWFRMARCKLSNTLVEEKDDLPEIAARERVLFWSEGFKRTVGEAMMAYDTSPTHDLGSAWMQDWTRTTNKPGTPEVLTRGQGVLLPVVAPIPTTAGLTVTQPVATELRIASDFNNHLTGNGKKWVQSFGGRVFDAVIHLQDLFDFFKHAPITRGVTLDLEMRRSSNRRSLQFARDYSRQQVEILLAAGAKLSLAVGGGRAGIRLLVPVYRPSVVMLNRLEGMFSKPQELPIIFERSQLIKSNPLLGRGGTWRVVNSNRRITKVLLSFNVADSQYPEELDSFWLHSRCYGAGATQLSMSLNGQEIPAINRIETLADSTGFDVAGSEMALAYLEFLKMNKCIGVGQETNYNLCDGVSYENFRQRAPIWTFQVSENYGLAPFADNTTSELVVKWATSATTPAWPSGNNNLYLHAIVYTMHEGEILMGTADEAQVRVR